LIVLTEVQLLIMIIPQKKMALPRQVLLSSIVCCSFVLAGCSAVMKPVRSASHTTGEIRLHVTLDPEVNDNSPLAVDVVLVSDKTVLKELSALTAQTWFEKRTTLLRMHASEIHVTSWEWIPGQEVATLKVPRTGIADGVLLFANYTSTGDHSSTLPRNGTIDIAFGPKDFKILPQR
jgi:type VI secretion system protein